MFDPTLQLAFFIILVGVVLFTFTEVWKFRKREQDRLDIFEKTNIQEQSEFGTGEPCWSMLLPGPGLKGRMRTLFVLKEVARNLKSEAAFFLYQSSKKPDLWVVPNDEIYTEIGLPTSFSIPKDCEIVNKAESKETVVIDPELQDEVPPDLKSAGVRSAILVPITKGKQQGLFVICNRKQAKHKEPYRLTYTRKDCEAAEVFAKVIL